MKEITKDSFDALDALCDMWAQYCPPPYTHQFMSAGERTELVRESYGLLGGDPAEVRWDFLEENRKRLGL